MVFSLIPLETSNYTEPNNQIIILFYHHRLSTDTKQVVLDLPSRSMKRKIHIHQLAHMCVGTFEAGRTLYYVCTSVLYKNIYKVSLYGIDVHMTYLMCIRLDEGPSLL